MRPTARIHPWFLGLATVLGTLDAFGQGTAFVQVTNSPQGNLSAISAASPGAPVILAQPVGGVAHTSAQFSFSFVATGGYPLFDQWYFNNSLIPHATNDSLVIPSVGPGDFGSYSVVVTDSLGAQVSSQPAQLWLDSDGDGLPDVWEIANFGSITNQDAVMDFDGDGNSNLTEFRDGTSPTDNGALLPRLSLRTIGGDVLLSPNNDHYNLGDTITLTAVPYPGLAFLCWSGDLTNANSSANLVMNGDKFVQATFGLPLNAALDVTNVFTTGGDGGWLGQTNDSHDGISAARTAPIIKYSNRGSYSWMQTTVTLTKDGTVSFWWTVDSPDQNNILFLIDNNRIFLNTRTIVGQQPWTHQTSFLAAGTHVLSWTFNHFAEGSSLDTGYVVIPQDYGMVDQVVITEYADPNLDTDGDGLPDLWEYKYFDTLAYRANDDPDGDGVNNLNEYLDGTLPNSSSSVKPRLNYTIEGGGTAAASPSQTEYDYGQTVTNTATPSPGWSFVAWRGPFITQTAVTTRTNNPSTVQLLMSQTVRAIFGLPLAQVTDQPSWTFNAGGELGWYGQTNVTLDGISAARSGPVSATGESWMETTVQGPGTLSYYWKVDSTTNTDLLTFLLNSNTQPTVLSGVADWKQQVYYLGAGTQTLRWRFHRNGGGDTNRQAAAWVDQVQFSTGNTKPSFVLQPADQTVMQISNAVIQVLANGTPTIQYQLFHGATPYGQPTNGTSLIISNPPPALAGTWTVQAGNAGGVTSSDPFTLNVIPAPPLNDNFADRYTLGPTDVVSGYNFAATKEVGEPDHGGYSGGASVWWKWTAPQTGKYRAVVQGTNTADYLVLGVYSGNSVSGLTPLGKFSSSSTNLPSGDYVQSYYDAFDAIAGTTYTIAVDTASALGVWFGLWVDYQPPPSNDMFANRTPLIGASASGASQLDLATAEPGEPAHDGFPAGNSVWWTWTAPRNGGVIVNAGSRSIIPRVAVYTGSTLASLQQVVAGFGGGATNLATIVTFNAASGTAYQIAVDGLFGTVGDIEINVALNQPSFVYPTVDAQGNLDFSVDGPAGASFAVDASTDLKTWNTIYTGTIPSSGSFDFQTAIPPGDRSRFFRVRLL